MGPLTGKDEARRPLAEAKGHAPLGTKVPHCDVVIVLVSLCPKYLMKITFKKKKKAERGGARL